MKHYITISYWEVLALKPIELLSLFDNFSLSGCWYISFSVHDYLFVHRGKQNIDDFRNIR